MKRYCLKAAAKILALSLAISSFVFAQTALAQEFQEALQNLPVSGNLKIYPAGGIPAGRGSGQEAALKEALLIHLLSQSIRVGPHSVRAEIFKFLDPAGAYSYLLAQASGPPENGACATGDDAIWCWRQKYVLRLPVQAGEGNALADSLRQVGQSWSESAGGPGSPPVLVRHLPRTGLLQSSIRYELGPVGLARHVEASMLEQFGMENDVEAVVAGYTRGESRGRLILLGYPTTALARQYAERLKQFNKTYPHVVGVKRAGVIVGVTAGMPPDMARQILERVQYAPSIKWIYKKEDDLAFLRRQEQKQAASLMGTVVTAILFTIVFCAATAFGGLGVGVLRYWLNEYTSFREKRAGRTGMIRLNLDRIGSEPRP